MVNCRDHSFYVSLGPNNVEPLEMLLIFAFFVVFAQSCPEKLKVLALQIFNAHFVQTCKDFSYLWVTTSTPKCVFRRLGRGMLASLVLCGILFFLPKSPTEILKLMLQLHGTYLEFWVSMWVSLLFWSQRSVLVFHFHSNQFCNCIGTRFRGYFIST